jgi:hypothetical protein
MGIDTQTATALSQLRTVEVYRWFSGIDNQMPGVRPGQPTKGLSFEEWAKDGFTAPVIVETVENTNTNSVWVIETQGLSPTALRYLKAAEQVKDVGYYQKYPNDKEVALLLMEQVSIEELEKVGTRKEGTEFCLVRTGEKTYEVLPIVLGLSKSGLGLYGQKEVDGDWWPVADMIKVPTLLWGQDYRSSYRHYGGTPILVGSEEYAIAIKAGWVSPYV